MPRPQRRARMPQRLAAEAADLRDLLDGLAQVGPASAVGQARAEAASQASRQRLHKPAAKPPAATAAKTAPPRRAGAPLYPVVGTPPAPLRPDRSSGEKQEGLTLSTRPGATGDRAAGRARAVFRPVPHLRPDGHPRRRRMTCLWSFRALTPFIPRPDSGSWPGSRSAAWLTRSRPLLNFIWR